MPYKPSNLFAPLPSLPSERTGEQILPLLKTSAFRLERIVSHGQASAEGFWYDQTQPEWVLLMRGRATLDFGGEGRRELRELKAGDCLLIPAHSKHRVESVSEDAIWLALHFSETLTQITGA
jgi:cupin 2 domain-containing protein